MKIKMAIPKPIKNPKRRLKSKPTNPLEMKNIKKIKNKYLNR